jgi:probable F420-dependent oxidoreductase
MTGPAALGGPDMKVRIGIALGEAGVPSQFAEAVAVLEEAGVDSLWLPEVVYGPLVDPFIGMAYALAQTTRLKVGTGIAVLPGRHPVLVAKQLASLAGLAPRRVLPVFGLKPARPGELAAFPVAPGRRAAVFDESLELIRLLLRQETVTFQGEFFSVEDARIGPLPAKPLDIWLGGSAPGALRRVGRLGDGWLASFLTPAEAAAGRRAIEAAAAAAGREVEPDHYGISLAVATGPARPALLAAARQRRPDADPAELVADGWPAARRMIEQYVAVGLTKFVIRPGSAPGGSDQRAPRAGQRTSTERFAAEFVRELMPLQT